MKIDYPPYYNIIQVFEQCPASIFIYISLWKRHPEKHFFLTKKQVSDEYCTVFPQFYQYLSFLQQIKILSYDEFIDFIEITLLPTQINAEGFTLC